MTKHEEQDLKHGSAPRGKVQVNASSERTERLARIASAIERGTYHVDAGAVAERIITTLRTPRTPPSHRG